MSGSLKRKLHGLLALGAALVFAGAGCTGVPDDLEDDDLDVASAHQGLAPVDADSPTDDEGDSDAPAGPSGTPGGSPTSGGTKLAPIAGPDPLPWHGQLTDDDSESSVAAPPMTHSRSGTPSNGNGGK